MSGALMLPLSEDVENEQSCTSRANRLSHARFASNCSAKRHDYPGSIGHLIHADCEPLRAHLLQQPLIRVRLPRRLRRAWALPANSLYRLKPTKASGEE